MFFRKKFARRSVLPSIQLIANERIGNKVKQIIVISLGTDYDLPETLYPDVAVAVEQKLNQTHSLFTIPRVDSIAEDIFQRIIKEITYYLKKQQIELQKKAYQEQTGHPEKVGKKSAKRKGGGIGEAY